MLRLDLRRSCFLRSEGARVEGGEDAVVELELAVGFFDGFSFTALESLRGRPRFRGPLAAAGFWKISTSFSSNCATVPVPLPDSGTALVCLLFARAGLSLWSLVLLRFLEAITRVGRDRCG